MGFWKDLWNDNEPGFVFERVRISEEELRILERMQMNKYKYDLLKSFPELKEKMKEIKQERLKEIEYD